jgi:hypothetical protein
MDFHVLSTHCRDSADTSPLQFISAEQLAYLQLVEAAAQVLVAVLSTAPAMHDAPAAATSAPVSK